MEPDPATVSFGVRLPYAMTQPFQILGMSSMYPLPSNQRQHVGVHCGPIIAVVRVHHLLFSRAMIEKGQSGHAANTRTHAVSTTSEVQQAG